MEEDFENTTPSNIVEYTPLDEDHLSNYSFISSYIYKYSRIAFQYVHPADSFYRSKSRRRVFYFMQTLAILFGCSAFGLKCHYIWVEIQPTFVKDGASFNLVLTLSHKIFCQFRMLAFQIIGCYTLFRHPLTIETQINSLRELVATEVEEERNSLFQSIKKCEKYINVLMGIAVFVSIGVPIVYLGFLVHANSAYPFSVLNCFMIIGFALSKVIALPIVFYMLMLVQLQKIHVEAFCQIIRGRGGGGGDFDLFLEYKKIHQLIASCSRNCSIYVLYLVIVFGLEASVGTYDAIVSVIHLLKEPVAYPEIAERVLALFGFLTETPLLLLIPILGFAKVSREQKKVVTLLLSLATNKDDMRINHTCAHSIELLQRCEGVGYQVWNSSISRWKTLSWVLVGPLVKVFISKLM